MKGLPEERAVKLAQYIIEQDATVRQAAKKFVISKSTVHKDVTQRLQQMNPQLWEQVKRFWSTINRNVISAEVLRQRKNMKFSDKINCRNLWMNP